MKKLIFILTSIAFVLILSNCNKKESVNPSVSYKTTSSENDTLVKFTLYSNRVPYFFSRQVNGKWIDDTIKTNNAVRYEPFDTKNFGVGYFATMKTNGITGDSLHIIGEYMGKMTQMGSPKLPHSAYVLLNNIKP